MVKGLVWWEFISFFWEEYINELMVFWGKLSLDVFSIYGGLTFKELINISFRDLVEEQPVLVIMDKGLEGFWEFLNGIF